MDQTSTTSGRSADPDPFESHQAVLGEPRAEMGERLTLDDIRHQPTITVDELAQVLGVSRGLAFESVRRGDLPSLRLGRRVVVPVPALLRALGDDRFEDRRSARAARKGRGAP